MASQRAFDRLRTKEQLGYIVFSGIRSTTAVAGYRLLVQSEKDPVYIESRIEAFLIEMESFLQQMTNEQFAEYQTASIHKKSSQSQTMLEEGDWLWDIILRGRYDFKKGRSGNAAFRSEGSVNSS
jgi:insulysin